VYRIEGQARSRGRRCRGPRSAVGRARGHQPRAPCPERLPCAPVAV